MFYGYNGNGVGETFIDDDAELMYAEDDFEGIGLQYLGVSRLKKLVQKVTGAAKKAAPAAASALPLPASVQTAAQSAIARATAKKPKPTAAERVATLAPGPLRETVAQTAEKVMRMPRPKPKPKAEPAESKGLLGIPYWGWGVGAAAAIGGGYLYFRSRRKE